MSNKLAKALKHKTDAMLRLQGQTQKPVVVEAVDGSFYAPEKSDYTAALAAGKNIQILVSGNTKTIHSVMGLLAGNNISVSAPDPTTGKVTVSGTISGKGINIADFAGKNGYVLTYNSASDKFELALSAGSYSLPQAAETMLGGIKAKTKTAAETVEAAIDPATGKMYVPAAGAATNGLPAGGSAGQVLSKIDGTNYNSNWIDAPTGSGGGAFTNLTDVPNSYIGKKNMVPMVSAKEDGLEFTRPLTAYLPGGRLIETFDGAAPVFIETISAFSKVTGGVSGLCFGTAQNHLAAMYTIQVNVPVDGFLNFDLKFYMSDSGYWDYGGFKFYIDNVIKYQTNISANTWGNKSFEITPGLHTIKFEKVPGLSFTSCRILLDNVSIPATGLYNMDAVTVSPNCLLETAPDGSSVAFIPKTTFMESLSGAALPTAAVGYRGKIFTLLGAAGVADTAYICLKNAADAYTWVAI